MNRSIGIQAYTLLAFVLFHSAPADVTVLRGSGPQFPLQVDGVFLTVKHSDNGRADSSVAPLPVSWYAEIRDNIDSTYTYPQALRAKKRELAGCPKGFKYGSRLTLHYRGACVLTLLFSCGSFRAAKCITSTDPYPFVLVFTKGFCRRLERLANGGK
jgi:hypothetical protein